MTLATLANPENAALLSKVPEAKDKLTNLYSTMLPELAGKIKQELNASGMASQLIVDDEGFIGIKTDAPNPDLAKYGTPTLPSGTQRMLNEWNHLMNYGNVYKGVLGGKYKGNMQHYEELKKFMGGEAVEGMGMAKPNNGVRKAYRDANNKLVLE